jgi:hypothetical protein
MAKKKHTDNEIINELVAVATPEITPEIELTPVIEAAPVAATAPVLTPGEYYQGKKIERYVSNLGKKAVAIIDGKRVKVLKADVVTVK